MAKGEVGVSLFSANINGLNNPCKRKRVFNQLAKANYDVICLQEVHVKGNQKAILENKRLGNLYVTLADQKKKGVAIYVKGHLESKLIYAGKKG